MRLPEARINVRLGATHPITKASHLSYLALRAEYCTDSEQVEALRRSRETVASAVNEFNTRATALLGSAVVPKTAPSTRDDVELRRLESLITHGRTSNGCI